MACTSIRTPLRSLVREASSAKDIPSFLLPAFARPTFRRDFSISHHRTSRVGSAAISIPPDVSLRFFDLPQTDLRSRKQDVPKSAVEVVGPRGQITLPLPPYLMTKYDEASKKVSLSIGDSKITHQRAMWGTMRAHLQNSISGVSEGHVCILRLVGVGYRASVEPEAPTTNQAAQYPGQEFVCLKLGYAHAIEMPVPYGVKATVPQPTRILLEGCDRQTVTQFAAEIRQWRKPEPYKGKGIFVDDETIRMKAKKIK